ncbi:MAG: DUF1836 domain-containing protein [Clostridia bacterium]|nr:DUF1836 domain-containing protein [Clostridia bacterium]
MGGVTGLEFLDKVFYITDGIMLAQIREITGIDGTTLQNWLKRGWVQSPTKKAYSKEHLARILIINMLRDTMQLSRIIYLLTYVNGNDPEDEIIQESLLYDYICRVLAAISDPDSAGVHGIDEAIGTVLSDYSERVGGAKRRISSVIRIIVISYYAAMLKSRADDLTDALGR